MLRKGTPEYLRSDNGSEFIANHLREWLSEMEVAPMYITPGSPWENGFVESFNGTMANELLNREIFDTLYEAKVLLACWVREYNTNRPHSSLGYRLPAPEAYLWAVYKKGVEIWKTLIVCAHFNTLGTTVKTNGFLYEKVEQYSEGTSRNHSLRPRPLPAAAPLKQGYWSGNN